MASCSEIFLILPGLNLNPAKLQPLGAFLLAQGVGVALPALTGFPSGGAERAEPSAGLERAWRGVRAENWLADLDRAQAHVLGRQPQAALSLFGYSMGAVLGLAWSLSRRQPLERAVLISPAFRLNWKFALPLRALCSLLPGHLRLPSLGPAQYLAHRGTSLAAYQALLHLMEDFQGDFQGDYQGGTGMLAGPDIARLPSRQFLAYSPKDELISMRCLSRYKAIYSAAAPCAITTHMLRHGPLRGATRHLAIDAHTLGDSEWAALLAALGAWLAG